MAHSTDEQVVIVGAGPYGHATAAHLRARGASVRVFGEPMSFWEGHMPHGMWLRSAWHASSISDPTGRLSLDAYDAQQPTPLPRPLRGHEFVRYGRWFAEQVVPDLDRRLVAEMVRTNGSFEVVLEDGERVSAAQVVIATGLRHFAQRPPEFDGLDPEVVVHSVDTTDLSRFAGRSVVVVGAGQSAVETAALLHEVGAAVELIGRAPEVRWLTRSARLHSLGPAANILYAPTDVGPPVLSWIVAWPNVFRRLPTTSQDKLAYRSIRPAAAGWLVDRTAQVKMTLGRRVVRAENGGSGVLLDLDDGSKRDVQHVVLATGYRVDVAKEPVLASLRNGLATVDGYPLLRRGFESSVSGLRFVGAYAAVSFGPVMRFVSGTPFTAAAVAQHLAGR
ncbi:MAG: FAD-dependent oxidoreductase [Thermoleophilaceae bacterium]